MFQACGAVNLSSDTRVEVLSHDGWNDACLVGLRLIRARHQRRVWFPVSAPAITAGR